MSAQPFPRRWNRVAASRGSWWRNALLLVLACSAATVAAPAAPGFPHSPYVAELDADNAWLPRTLGYQLGEQVIPVLAENVGLNFTFTDFRLRNKFYREENRHTWGERQDPRFVTEPRAVGNPGAFVDGAGGEVNYQTSYASVTRSYVLGAERLTIQYDVTPLAPLRIHEPGMFGIVLHLAPGWNRQAVVDVRGEQPAWLWATTDQPAPYSVTSSTSARWCWSTSKRDSPCC